MSTNIRAAVQALPHCPECVPRLPLRNHWFWGKHVVPRDLTDEQLFFLEKLRLHHQRLHGAGIVCGLELRQHPNLACRDRLVVLTPGSAVDCCGHDILVLDEDVIDLERFELFRNLVKQPDGKPHTLQFCIRYRECPTEEVPVLYDECACDDTRCAPNRILETYSIELAVDPPPLEHPVLQPQLERVTTISINDTSAVLLDEAGDRLFVLAGPTLFELDNASHAIRSTRPLGTPGRTMTLAKGGVRLDLAVGGNPTTDPDLVVIDIALPATAASATERKAPLADSKDGSVVLAETAAGRLVAALEPSGVVRVWAAGIPTPGTQEDQRDLPVATAGLTLSSDGSKAFLAEPGTATIHVVALDTAGLPTTTITLTSTIPGFSGKADWLALVATSGPDRLAVLDRANLLLHLADPATGKVDGSVALDHEPIDLAMSVGGHWAYVVVDDGTDSYVQTVNLQLLRQGKPVQASTPVKIGPKGGRPVLASDGRRLYVPILNATAVFDITDVDCAALLDGGPCPGCFEPDCLVLATILNWQPGFKLEDLGPEPRDPATDTTDKIARIDNNADRVTLPSTQAIAAALRCLIEHGTGGGEGPPGPPGPQGEKGEKGENGQNGQNGAQGPAGESAVDKTLAHICAISWKHGERSQRGELNVVLGDREGTGLVVAFRCDLFPEPGKVLARDIHDISFMVLMEHAEVEEERLARFCWCQIPAAEVLGVQLREECLPEVAVPGPFPDGFCNGAVYLFDRESFERSFDRELQIRARLNRPPEIRIRAFVNGDFIRDRKERALDADHLPLWLPARESGDFIAGGMFESFFTLTP
jgi:hypothetical protein